MKLISLFAFRHGATLLSRVVGLTVISAAILLAGCGAGTSPTPLPPVQAGSTSVSVMLSSTSNGQFSAFPMTLNSIALTNNSGKAVDLLTTPQMVEFSHLNATVGPLVTVTVPQGTYTSATVMYSNPEFTYINISPTTGGLAFHTDANILGVQSATVNLPSPITVSGTSMGLFLDLQVSKSATCSCNGTLDTYSINPAFNLTPVAISSQPTNIRNGKLTGIRGRVTSVNAGGNSLGLAANNGWSFSFLANGPMLSVAANGSTVYQRTGGLSSLTPGMFVDLDAAVQSDGSLLAARIEVQDPTALNVMIGPVVEISPLAPEFIDFGRQQQGDELSVNPINFETYSYTSSAVFQTSGQLSVPANLPFTATFDAANMVSGQNVAVSFNLKSHFGGTFTTANTITLMPQTVNGTVSGISTSGTFTIYRITLPAYDVIPTLNGATSVFAYVDGNTQMFSSSPVGEGSVVRFNGLLFNDAGTLRMVTAQVNDGVPQ